MKLAQKDMGMLIGAFVVAFLLFYVGNKFVFSNSASKNTTVDVVPVIRTDFPAPSTAYFNAQAIDPTQIINISPNNSQTPFNNGNGQ